MYLKEANSLWTGPVKAGLLLIALGSYGFASGAMTAITLSTGTPSTGPAESRCLRSQKASTSQRGT